MSSLLGPLPALNLEPLWSKMDRMVPALPEPKARPHQWKYAECYPHLLKAGRMVAAEDAERRVLMLVNPALESPFTTDTIYGGLQLVNPGETAPAHRHIAFAFRFIIDGEGFTAVEGKRMTLRRGDFVVTPTWHWHDHGNESDAPVVWLDALNLPVFTFLRVHFAEGYHDPRYPSEPADPCEWRFPWDEVETALNATAGTKNHAVHHYVSSRTGKPLSATLGAQAERIAAGSSSEASQSQCSFMYHVYEGKGRSTITTPATGETVEYSWQARDTFVVPAWAKVQHFNDSEEEPAYLVAVHDRPMLENLGLIKPGL
ncbi:RmlC-like cupin domain-containing protein [Microdochium trichocladiopsis]|uniref:RmlC-like cupin domain-containing protein n=1 Tax=Microdochium trichocladiopsis TaxID=1682393 RepID=A0A9P8XUU8_9PEZI|nr:RmlC-like cupin domain-containing protein [Microdochium trichocladiopsis]KAH7014173.1 RmlC-like cupin domain-containing protein [Microdochium trichocladiopsis]